MPPGFQTAWKSRSGNRIFADLAQHLELMDAGDIREDIPAVLQKPAFLAGTLGVYEIKHDHVFDPAISYDHR